MNGTTLLLFFLTSTFAYADGISEKSTWQEIRTVKGVFASFPTIPMNYGSFSVDELCLDGDSLRPHKPYREVCVQVKVQGNQDICLKKESVRVSAPRVYVEKTCLAWNSKPQNSECLESKETSVVRSLLYAVDVFREPVSPNGTQKLLFKKSYTIPSCY